MKPLLLILAGALMLPALMSAQEKSPKERKTMVFQPGAKTPDRQPDAAPAAPPVPASPPAAAPPAAAPAVAVPSAPPPGLDEPGQAASAFFTLLQRGKIDEAYANLIRGSKIGERPEELQSLKAKTNEAISVFGAVQGFEVVETKTVGASLMRRTYLSLGKDFPLRWRFYFYRIAGQWRLVDLRVDDRLSGMFEEQEEPRAPEPKAP